MSVNSSSVLQLSEYFYSIQGEGISAGRPAVFVRFGFCPLKCVWCDSAYTWDKTRFNLEDEINPIPVQHVVDFYTTRFVSKAHLKLILTGGEPLMPLHTSSQIALIDAIQNSTKESPEVEIETAGVYLISDELFKRTTQINVSPKLASSGNSFRSRYKLPILKAFANTRKAQFKFVITQQSDIQAVVQDFLHPLELEPHRISLSPEGTNEAALAANRLWLIDICKDFGFHYSDRLHVIAYGYRRGV